METMNKSCKNCGKSFETRDLRKLHCSKECSKETIRKRQLEYYRKNNEEVLKRKKTCKYCEGEFLSQNLKGRCCNSQECKEKYKKEQKQKAQKKYYNKELKRKTEQYRKKDRERSRAYRKRHKAELKKKEIEYKIKNSGWIDDYKKNHSCPKCNEDRYFCLDFHHLNPENKKFNIAQSYKLGYSRKTIEKEIEKCILLCRNCHQHLHYLEKVIEGWQPSEEWLNNKEIYK